MLSTDNLKHCLEVARYMYSHAEEILDNPTEEERRDLWLLGLVHDIGREFSRQDGIYHGEVGAKMLERAGFIRSYEVANHGIKFDTTKELKLLNVADWHIDSKGKRVDPKARLENIAKNHSKKSQAYQCAKEMYAKIKKEA